MYKKKKKKLALQDVSLTENQLTKSNACFQKCLHQFIKTNILCKQKPKARKY